MQAAPDRNPQEQWQIREIEAEERNKMTSCFNKGDKVLFYDADYVYTVTNGAPDVAGRILVSTSDGMYNLICQNNLQLVSKTHIWGGIEWEACSTPTKWAWSSISQVVFAFNSVRMLPAGGYFYVKPVKIL